MRQEGGNEMLEAKLDEVYLNWLYSRVDEPGRPSYMKLMRLMFRTKFEWFVAHDDNRAIDGQNLRREFIFSQRPTGVTDEWEEIDCSFLEMLIALAERMCLQLDIEMSECFWMLLDNVDLLEQDDDNFDRVAVERTLEIVNDRTYMDNGVGGLFPLRNSGRNQRYVELIYQMYAYIMEIYE